MLAAARRLRKRFYAGPPDLGIRPFRYKNYQSPTATALLWGYAFACRHLSMGARMIVICCGVLFPYAMLNIYMPIHYLAFGIAGLFVADFFLGLALSSRIKVQREIPQRLGVGVRGRVRYTVRNVSRRPALNVAVDVLPYPKSVHLRPGRPRIGALGPRATASFDIEIEASRRGEFMLPAVRAVTGFPFFLWQWGRTTGYPQRLLVYPRFTPLRRIDLPMGLQYQPGGVSLSSKVGEGMEFLGCREFRDGDNPRHIHWRSWARVGFPVVKEFREEYLCRAAVILDTAVPHVFGAFFPPLPGDARVFEAAVSLTAAAGEYLSRTESVIDFFAAAPELYRLQMGRSLGWFENLLDILASVKPHPAEPFQDLIPVLVREVRTFSSALVFLTAWNDVRRALLEELAAENIHTRAVLVVPDERRVPDGVPPHVTVVTASDIEDGRCIEL